VPVTDCRAAFIAARRLTFCVLPLPAPLPLLFTLVVLLPGLLWEVADTSAAVAVGVVVAVAVGWRRRSNGTLASTSPSVYSRSTVPSPFTAVTLAA